MNAALSPPDAPPPGLKPTPHGTAPIHCWRWWIHLILIGGYVLLIGLFGREQSQKETHVPALSHTAHGLLAVCAIQLLIFALVFGLALVASRASRDDLLLRWRYGFWTVPLGVGYSVAIRLAVGLAAMMVSVTLIATHVMTAHSLHQFLAAHRPNLETIVDISAMRQDPLYFWLTLTVVSFVLAGLREELWRSAFLAGLRGLWPQRFESRSGRIIAVAIAAVVFGFGHLGLGLVNVLFAGLLGFGLGLIMIFHRSIWPAVIAHGMFDATTFALLPWLTARLPELQRTLGH